MLVPLTINYISAETYGIWLTLTSIVTWFSFFDIGFGHGLRNKLAEAIANGEKEKGRIYVSTTYAVLSIIIGIALGLFFVINPYLNWSKILNAPATIGHELSLLALIVFSFFCLQFVFKLLNIVMTANQEPARASLHNFLGNVLSLVLIYALTKFTSSNLIFLGLALSAAPVIILLIAGFILYHKRYREYAPSLNHIDFSYAKELMGLGGKFFIINISVLVMLNTDHIIILQLLGSTEVTVFNVTHRIFAVVTMVYGIIATPLWSAYTDAYTKSDFEWIKKTVKVCLKIWYGLIGVTVLILLASPMIFDIWLGDTVDVPFVLSIAMSTYVISYVYQTIYSFLLNGVGKIKLQLYISVFAAIIHIPLALFLCDKFGLVGLTLLSTYNFLLTGIIFSIQSNKILNRTASHIWNK